MTFRSKQTLDAWIEEFQRFGYSL
ncbi:MAG: hypothetical protein K0S49_860, partial [Microbacterium sp.]|nr:hypothetical protein [Microbacterium sp.]